MSWLNAFKGPEKTSIKYKRELLESLDEEIDILKQEYKRLDSVVSTIIGIYTLLKHFNHRDLEDKLLRDLKIKNIEQKYIEIRKIITNFIKMENMEIEKEKEDFNIFKMLVKKTLEDETTLYAHETFQEEHDRTVLMTLYNKNFIVDRHINIDILKESENIEELIDKAIGVSRKSFKGFRFDLTLITAITHRLKVFLEDERNRVYSLMKKKKYEKKFLKKG